MSAVVAASRRRTTLVRRNLVPNPSLSVNATGWSGLSGARTTSAHATMPRSTAWVWTDTAGDVITPLCAITAGAAYRASATIRPGATGTGRISIRWYDDAATLLGSSPTSITLTSGSTTRYETALILAPDGATQARVSLNNLTVTGQATAVLLEQDGASAALYFDGDTPGAAWSGTAGASPSTMSS